MYAIKDYLMAMGQGILEKIATPTILLLMDTDFANYSQLISENRIIIILAIVISLILSNLILVFIYIVRNKISYVYSCFSCLSQEEIKQERILLSILKQAFTHSCYYEEIFREDFIFFNRTRIHLDNR